MKISTKQLVEILLKEAKSSKISKSDVQKIWSTKDTNVKKELIRKFINSMTGDKSKLLSNLEKINKSDKFDTFVANLYLHSIGLSVKAGSSDETASKRKNYLNKKKKKKKLKEGKISPRDTYYSIVDSLSNLEELALTDNDLKIILKKFEKLTNELSKIFDKKYNKNWD